MSKKRVSERQQREINRERWDNNIKDMLNKLVH